MKKLLAMLMSIVLILSCCSAFAEDWICPNCGKTNDTAFCTSCGTKHEVWTCPNCGAENADAYCGNCGTPRPATENTSTKSEGPAQFKLRMDGSSMIDAIQEGDMLTFECREIDQLKRLDIVAVNYPDRGNTIFVKRLVGLPGDTVELKDGFLYVNGELYTEEYINDDYRTGRMNVFGPYTVPEGSFFVLGDHRNNSNDSRFIGPIPGEMVLGVLVDK